MKVGRQRKGRETQREGLSRTTQTDHGLARGREDDRMTGDGGGSKKMVVIGSNLHVNG